MEDKTLQLDSEKIDKLIKLKNLNSTIREIKRIVNSNNKNLWQSN